MARAVIAGHVVARQIVAGQIVALRLLVAWPLISRWQIAQRARCAIAAIGAVGASAEVLCRDARFAG